MLRIYCSMLTRDGRALQSAGTLLAEAVAQRAVPGAVALVRRGGETVLHEAHGAAALEPAFIPMTPDTVFDLASLTKPMVTTPVVLILMERGLLELDERAECYLPELAGHPVGASTLRALLTHSSGVQAWYPIYERGSTREAVLSAIAELPLASEPGTQVEYSCLGFILLGILAERVTGRPLDRLARELVFEPLGLTTTGYDLGLAPDRYAWTERGNAYEHAKLKEEGTAFNGWCEGFWPGRVHDGNARYAMGGISGNAGLFSTAAEVGVLGQMWLDGGQYGGVRILSPQTVAPATRDLTPGLNLGRGLGWQVPRAPLPGETGPRSSGSRLSPRTFGHTGFTGTSIWIDPDDDLVIVLLTNRVHPEVTDDGTAVIALRQRFHDAVALALKGR